MNSQNANWTFLDEIVASTEQPSATHILNGDQWNRYLGAIWYAIFHAIRLPRDGTIVEVAPGKLPKIGLGLQRYGFQGTVVLVDLERNALEEVTKIYKQLLPRANVIPICATLVESIAQIPKKTDGLFSNHAIDDMLLFEALPQTERSRFFENLSNKSPTEVQNLWNKYAPQETWQDLTNSVSSQWIDFTTHTQPRWVVISQYETLAHVRNNFKSLDQLAYETLEFLRRKFNSTPSTLMGPLFSAFGQESKFWLAHPVRSTLKQDVISAPDALSRHGEDIFVRFKAYQLKDNASEVLFINKELSAKLGYDEFLSEPDLAYAYAKTSFSFDAERSEQLTTHDARDVWSDRQVDPSGISMNENAGSGRAAYFGKHFNKKGLGRTPLVQVPKDSLHGTGRCPLVGAVWETIVSNTVATNLHTGGPEILSAFLLNHRFTKPGITSTSGPVTTWRAATLERIDRGTLDRPTHLLLEKSKLPRPKLIEMARQFGKQEAEKFIERILQGAWSAGNISNDGKTLDLEAACAVDGRYPQYTLQSWFETNYFGLEWKGQLRVLETMCQSPAVNIDRVTVTECYECFERARSDQIARRFLDLLGVAQNKNPAVFTTKEDTVRDLSKSFETLATKMFPNLMGLDSRNKEALATHVFDFSTLFRRYLLVREATLNLNDRIETALELLTMPKRSLAFKDNPSISNEVRTLIKSEFTVTDESEYLRLKNRAKSFVTELEFFLNEIEKEYPKALSWQDAYRVNEDRPYLSASYGHQFVEKLCNAFDSNDLTLDLFRYKIELLHRANDRRPLRNDSNFFDSDFRIFREAEVFRRVFADGTYELHLGLYRGEALEPALSGDWRVEFLTKTHRLAKYSSNAIGVWFCTPKLNDDGLRKVSLFMKFVLNGGRVRFHDYCTLNPRAPHPIVLE